MKAYYYSFKDERIEEIEVVSITKTEVIVQQDGKNVTASRFSGDGIYFVTKLYAHGFKDFRKSDEYELQFQ